MAESNFKKHLWAGVGTILVPLLVQLGYAVYWAGNMNARMISIETGLARFESRLHEMEVSRLTGNFEGKPPENRQKTSWMQPVR
jgi:hypothetical protein